MFDHLGFYTTGDLRLRGEFYAAVLEPLGYRLLQSHLDDEGAGRLVFGDGERQSHFLVIAKGRPDHWAAGRRPGPIHLAFRAPSKEAVDRFHAAGLRMGARDNGAPGPRHRDWYAAYLIDADDNGVEAGLYL